MGQGNRKKNNSRGKAAATILSAITVTALVAAAILGMKLLNSISRPGEPIKFGEAEDDIIMTPASPAPPPTPGPLPDPEATPAPPPLPMSELYNQTALGEAAREKLREEAEDGRYINILLIGVDRRGNKGNSNTDTLMIATIDTVNHRLKLASIMRDTLVNIPGYGYGKLNSAAVKGGIGLLFETLNSAFELNLSEYVLVDFNMFEKIVDGLNGVTVCMTAEEISAANDCIAGLNKQRGLENTWDGFIFAGEGNVKLSGKQALGYARIRKIDSDFARSKRQFKLLNSIFALFMKADAAKQYRLLQDILPMVETNMSNERIISCAAKALDMDEGGLLYCRIPADGLFKSTRYEHKYVILSDMPANAEALHSFIYDSAQEAEEAKVLKPVESMPPRTPAIYMGADGNYYYYGSNAPVYGGYASPTPYAEGTESEVIISPVG